MRQRVMIAMSLINNPDLLIADEPTTALDVTTQAQILRLIKSLQNDFGSAVIMVTHDLGVVAEVADKVLVMYAGKVAEQGDVDEIFFHPNHPYTWGLLNSLPRLVVHGGELRPIPGTPPSLLHPPPGCRFHLRCPHRMDVCSVEVPPLEPLVDQPRPPCGLPPRPRSSAGRRPTSSRRRCWPRPPDLKGRRPPVAEELLVVEDLEKHFPIKRGIIFQKEIGRVRAVDGVSFVVNKGETLGVVGESGCGKSTMARCVMRLLDPTGGKVVFDGQDITHLNRRDMMDVRKKLMMVFQDPYASLNARKRVGLDHRRGARGAQDRRRRPRSASASRSCSRSSA